MNKVYSHSVPGPYHVREGLPNQDYMGYYEADGITFLALADGAGSLANSDIGAKDAVHIALDVMSHFYGTIDDEELTSYAIEQARKIVLARENYRSYGSTLTVAYLTSDGIARVGALGDSFAVLRKEENEFTLARGETVGEYANITTLLTSKDAQFSSSTHEGVTGIALASDGLEQVAIQEGEAHDGFWAGLFQKAEEDTLDIAKLYRWLDSLDRLVDDTSLMLLANPLEA